jgi:hypothetical protein
MFSETVFNAVKVLSDDTDFAAQLKNRVALQIRNRKMCFFDI